MAVGFDFSQEPLEFAPLCGGSGVLEGPAEDGSRRCEQCLSWYIRHTAVRFARPGLRVSASIQLLRSCNAAQSGPNNSASKFGRGHHQSLAPSHLRKLTSCTFSSSVQNRLQRTLYTCARSERTSSSIGNIYTECLTRSTVEQEARSGLARLPSSNNINPRSQPAQMRQQKKRRSLCSACGTPHQSERLHARLRRRRSTCQVANPATTWESFVRCLSRGGEV